MSSSSLPLSYNYILDYCELCSDTVQDVYIVTSCNHVFHKHCINVHLDKTRTCPICFKKIYRIKENDDYLDYYLDYFFLCC